MERKREREREIRSEKTTFQVAQHLGGWGRWEEPPYLPPTHTPPLQIHPFSQSQRTQLGSAQQVAEGGWGVEGGEGRVEREDTKGGEGEASGAGERQGKGKGRKVLSVLLSIPTKPRKKKMKKEETLPRAGSKNQQRQNKADGLEKKERKNFFFVVVVVGCSMCSILV